MTNMHTSGESGNENVESGFVPDGMRQPYLVLRFLAAASFRYAWRSLKNGVKVLLGRKTEFDENGLFLRQYVLHLTGIRPIRKITCRGLPSEGAGSQALMVMNAINFARFFGLAYVHTPFAVIEHAERPMEEWAASWETLFNLGARETACDVEKREVVNFCYSFSELDLCFGWRRRGDELANAFRALIPELRRKYYRNKSPRATDEVTVAVHIRRGDVSAGNSDYFTSNETVLHTIATVKSILEARKVKYKIHVYSQGSSADFAELSLAGVELFLDVDAVWTMQELIEADILIMAKGCFSFCAGLISDGIKIFEPANLSGDNFLPSWKWRSVALAESWVPSGAHGSLDHETFERQLVHVIQAKAELEGLEGNDHLAPEEPRAHT
jgi:hypothetical protein